MAGRPYPCGDQPRPEIEMRRSFTIIAIRRRVGGRMRAAII